MPLFSFSITQTLLAFVSASLLHKLTFNRFFLRWLASHRFSYYRPPNNYQLKHIKNKGRKGHGKQKGRTKRDDHIDKDEVFKIPSADLDSLELVKETLQAHDLEILNYSIDLEWIVDLALMSLLSLSITQVRLYFYPQTECNFSLLWALLVIFYSLKILWKLTTTYFKNEQTIGERSICIIAGCLFLLLAMLILIADENRLELGLETAYKSFNQSATTFVRNHTFSTDRPRPKTRPISFILVKFTIAILCSLVGVVFTFPGLRYGQLHKALLDNPEITCFQQIKYNLNYLAPLFVVLLWIKPLSRNLFLNQDFITIDDATYDAYRIYFVIIINFLRFRLMPEYLARFLLSASNRITRIRYRGGMTTNREIQIVVSSIYSYVNVVAIQYVLPIVLCGFAAVMLQVTGESPGLANSPQGTNLTLEDPFFEDESLRMDAHNASEDAATNYTVATHMVDLSEIKKIFSPHVFQGIFSLATWWLHLSLFCTTTTGVIYHNYFIH